MGLASLEATWRRKVDKAITDTLTDEGISSCPVTRREIPRRGFLDARAGRGREPIEANCEWWLDKVLLKMVVLT